ncbi:beta-ketoacyl synthase N-terminal-like domain-containing protein [Streptomyces sp. DSM 42041]|uniref:Beta-ketoacyl synthase N-terminal-like domain-containing protein n=1 Tax=Streptomyces hazeniae TaxID=3075538 RepID=A0ABU2NMT5_9ACTN|nr:polyketide synthase [Streptomyces sp. DSM 42041]MDT0377528.1 beta-ketoacyl synthase N-terminal-like domain-containing protein [Streptomyces sp. DSM 42041]
MSSRTPVAIVGMSALFPGASGLDAYWRNIVGGVDSVTDVPAARWDPEYYAPDGPRRADRVYCRRGGFVDQDAEFDAARFGIMPASVPGTEPDQLLALQVAHRSLVDAGGEAALPTDRQRAGVVLGRGGYLTPGLVRLDQRVRTAHQVARTLRELVPELDDDRVEQVRAAFAEQLGPEQPESAIGLVPNLAASRVANRLDLRGPAYTVDAACASSLVAVDQAVRELDAGRCDVMLAGGVHHCHDITLWSVFSQLGALSPSQRIRPLHRGADGVLIGEGTGIVVLKRLADAERDGDRVYAVVSGTGVASDGRSASLLNPDPGGQVRAVRQAWDAAGLDPRAADSVGLLEAHGTATPAGDKAELSTIAEVFGPAGDHAPAAIGSVKSMIGHTMPAAGIAGLIKAALALHHGVLPPTLHCEDPHPALAETRFAPLAQARPWEAPRSGTPRRAGVNAFGFGGINAHVVLEQPAGAPAAPAPTATVSAPGASAAQARTVPGGDAPRVEVSEPERVLRLAAPDPASLAALLDADDSAVLAASLDERDPVTEPVRLGIVDPTERRLALARKAVAKGRAWRGRSDVWFSPQPLLGPAGGRTAFVFPGLEAEFTPRVAELAQWFALPWSPGEDARVGDVGRHGTAVFQLGRMLDTALRRLDIVPDAVAGHSVGEWTAMACGGIHAADEVDRFLAGFDPDALQVPGAVFAVLGLPAQRVLEELGDRTDVVLSHDNTPNQSMVCGPEEEVEALVLRLRAEGVIGQVLPFRSGFHTPMLEPYLEPIRRAAETYTLHPQTTEVWSATTAAPFPTEPDAVRALFVRHLLEPVRFRLTVLALHDAGFRAFVQLGAGQLGSLIDDILAGRDHLTVSAHAGSRDSLAQLRRVVTALWADGGTPDAVPLLDRAAASGAGAAAAPTRSTASASAGAPPERPGVRLDLGGALVSLPPQVRRALRPAASAGPAERNGALARLEQASDRFPAASELAALLHDTAAVATELIGAEGARRGPTAARPAVPGAATPRPALPRAAALRPRPPARTAPAAPAPAQTAPVPEVLRVDVRTMPYLLDHCFFRQRPGWPDDVDRWPIVPATTVITHMMEIAERAVPGMRAVAVHDVRLMKWIEALPAVDVPVTVRRPAPDRVEVSLDGSARAEVELAPAYPQPPRPWPVDAAAERKPEMEAEQLYSERWMFHGPRFQGVSELTAIGERHVRGVLTAPAAPGALMDNIGQLLGYWIMASLTERTTVFPVRMEHIRFHGPEPRGGERLTCHVRITELTERALVADMQLARDGRVWAEFTGWADRRFDTDPGIRAVDRFPGQNTLSTLEPDGPAVVHERWPDLATRELIMHNMLGSAERARYEELPPIRRRQWLLGRIAAKDAVRGLLWREGEGEVYPAEIALHNDASGRPLATGVHGRTLGELTVSLAHRAEVAVALARRGPCGVDVEEITERPRATVEAACGPEERELLDTLVSSGGDDEPVWFTRFWAAKEAVAKARGTGLAGRPAAFRVVAADPDQVRVAVDGTTYDVSVRLTANPSTLPERRYVLAWTTSDERTGEHVDH